MHIVISAVSSARQPSGICRHAANLAGSLATSHEVQRVTLVVGSWQREYFHRAFAIDSSVCRVVDAAVKNDALSRNAWYYFQLPRLARQRRADIVHLSFPAPIRRSAFSCSVVSSLHDLYPYDAPMNFGLRRAFFNRLFLRRCLNASDAVVCSSDFTKRRLALYASEVASEKAVRIYQGVALDPNQEREPESPEFFRRPFLLAVAQHRRNKNLDLFLTAFARLRKARLQLRLVIVGAVGPETNAIHALAQRLGVQDQVAFRAGLSDAELCWLYRRCELLAVTSSIEGFCFPVVEALRCGSRVVCSDIPVLREVGGPRCHYFELNDPQPASALARAMESALSQPRAEQQQPDRFSCPDIAREYCAVYARLLGREHPLTPPLSYEPLESARYDRAG